MRVQRAWAPAAVALVAACFAAYAAAILLTKPESDVNQFFTLWFYQGLLALSALLAALRALTVARNRLAWTVIALALACWSFGDIYYTAKEPEAYPSPADYGWLAFYPLVYVGLVLLLPVRRRPTASTLWLDGAIATLAAAALGAAVLVELVLDTTEGSLSQAATNLAYPLGDVLLLAAVFGVFSLLGWRLERRWLVLGLGVLATAIADSAYLLQGDAYLPGADIDVLWPASTLLIAAAAWMREPEAAEVSIEGRPLLVVPAACALLATSILLYDHFHRTNLLALVLASAVLVLVVLRLALTFRENRRLYELTKHESVTDALTELGNRRKLVADLDDLLAGHSLPPTLLLMFDLDGFKSYNDSFGHPAGDALLARLGAKLAAVGGGEARAYRLGGDEFCLITPVQRDGAEPLIDAACAALSEHGEGFSISTSFGAVVVPDEATDPSAALRLGDERLYAQKHARRAETNRATNELLDALAEHAPAAPQHPTGVTALAAATGRALGLRRDELEELERAAQLHDIGELAVPDEILHKDGTLDEREWEFIRQHTLVGERILRASPAFRSVAAIVRSTHERWDGRGYPDGLAGEEIPLLARIIAACDAYVAMTSARPYRAALTSAEALAELELGAGSQFDPRVVQALAALVREAIAAGQAA